MVLLSEKGANGVSARCEKVFGLSFSSGHTLLHCGCIECLVGPHSQEVSSQVVHCCCCCAGVYAGLVAQLQTEMALSQLKAAEQIQALMRDPQSDMDAITVAGPLPLLVAFLKSDRPAVQEPVAGALWDITWRCSQQNKDGFVAADAVPALTALRGQTFQLCKRPQQAHCAT